MTTFATKNPVHTYGAYYSPRDLKEDASLTHVGRGTPGGELLRRYWQPIAYTQELTDLPKKIRVLGEDLVLFRTGAGEFGLIEERCAHRGASMEYGVIGHDGITCAYHGFKYGTDGTILATGSGAPMQHAGKLCLGAYALHVFKDLIFAYLGPPDKKPPFPMLDIYEDPNIEIEPGIERACVNECNWLQIHENAMDPVHTAYLHVLTTGTQRGFSDELGVVPHLQWNQTEHGMYYAATRRVGDLVWVRVLDVFMPNFGLIPPSDKDTQKKGNISQQAYVAAWVVPIDDHNSKRMYLRFNDHRNPLRPVQRAMNFGQKKDRTYEEGQRHPGDYEMFVSQGPIAIHGYENLTPTDYGIIALRQMLKENIRAVQEGRDPLGVVRDPGYRFRTRTQNTYLPVPAAATPEAELALLKRISHEVAEGSYQHQFPPA